MASVRKDFRLKLKSLLLVNKKCPIIPENTNFKLDVLSENEYMYRENSDGGDAKVNTDEHGENQVQCENICTLQMSSALSTSSVFESCSWCLYVLRNPVHEAYGRHVYVIDITNDMSTVSFVSSYPTMLQTYKKKVLFVKNTNRASELKRRVYEALHMFQIHLDRPLFKCRLELIISEIERTKL